MNHIYSDGYLGISDEGKTEKFWQHFSLFEQRGARKVSKFASFDDVVMLFSMMNECVVSWDKETQPTTIWTPESRDQRCHPLLRRVGICT